MLPSMLAAITEILLGSRSTGKLREIATMSPAGIRWRSLADFPAVPEATEDADTFLENATAKAVAYARQTGLTTLADDSGIEVDALGGAPGVHSAYYAGHPRDDAANNRKLLEAMRGVPAAERTARFRCTMVLAEPTGRVLHITTGAVEGAIIESPRGENGFGYDPVFLLPDRGVTMAQIGAEAKNEISHRGKALREMVRFLQGLNAECRMKNEE